MLPSEHNWGNEWAWLNPIDWCKLSACQEPLNVRTHALSVITNRRVRCIDRFVPLRRRALCMQFFHHMSVASSRRSKALCSIIWYVFHNSNGEIIHCQYNNRSGRAYFVNHAIYCKVYTFADDKMHVVWVVGKWFMCSCQWYGGLVLW